MEGRADVEPQRHPLPLQQLQGLCEGDLSKRCAPEGCGWRLHAELGGAKWRAIKLFKGDKVNVRGLKKLLIAAVAFNDIKAKGKGKSRRVAF